MCDESFRLKDAALVCAGRPEQHVVRSVYADAPPHCKPEGKALSRHEACRLHFVKRHGFKGLQKRVGPLEKTAGLFGRAAFFKRLNRHGVVDRKVADARAAKSRQMSAAPKPAPKPAPKLRDPYIRAENEDDDGYDPYSDRRPEREPMFEADPWR